ncbi:hypothetical protein H1235_10205 [Pseudoxanthomonas sp. NC8]|nr:hypothetical protein H1235_10205 [Pseudoxanthomonas sp. NC8]
MRKLLVLLSLGFPLLAQAEVMDKEPSIVSILAMAIAFAVFGFLAARYKPGWLIVVLPISGLIFGAQLMEITSADVGPAIRLEAGAWYIVASWAGPFVQALAVGTGWRIRRCAPNSSSKPNPLRGSA